LFPPRRKKKKEQNMTTDKDKIGLAGEFLAASKLSAMGYNVGLTGRNTIGVDIIVSNGKTAKNIQVKTTTNKTPKWRCPMPKDGNENFVYIFVILDKNENHSFHIVPCKKVVEYLTRDGDENDHHFFRDSECNYKNKWENLKL
jgi:hypothetical protein